MTTLNSHCCELCRHSLDEPCPDRVECMMQGPLCHDSDECTQRIRAAAAVVRRENRTKPLVFVGAGTCGLGAGAGQTIAAIEKGLVERDIDAEVIRVGCVGLCSAEPLVELALPGGPRVAFANVSADVVPRLLDEALAGHPPADLVLGQNRTDGIEPVTDVPFLDEHPFFAPQTRWVLPNCGVIDPASIDEYIAGGGYRAFAETLRTRTPAEVCDTVIESGLRGRGGGGFPTGRKWHFALGAPSDRKYLVCNADEGDPGAFMDRAVIEGDPHRLLEGMAIAAYAIGARHAYIYIRAEYPLAIERLRVAIDQATEYGLLGFNILDSGFNLDIRIKTGAGAFVCGEETALIHSIEGKRGMPRPRPPYPATNGLFGNPTVINNVETLANVPGILHNGAKWFAAVGTDGSKGTKVFALSGKVARTGLVEVAMGTTVRQIVFDIGGGVPEERTYKAVQIGGPSGGCIPEQHLDIDIDYDSLKTVGAMMGSGGLVVMDDKNCMIDVAKFFMGFIQRESCGKCIPCREGTRQMLHILESLTRPHRDETGDDALRRFQGVLNIERLARVIKDTSLCGLGQTAPNPVLSTLRYFRDEYEQHIYERTCPAGACTALLRYRIDADRCRGCTVCAKKCPTGAIMGAVRSPHYIVPEKCIGCGTCVDVCKFDAVIKE